MPVSYCTSGITQMAQEIGILPEEDDYINPFRAAEPQTVSPMHFEVG